MERDGCGRVGASVRHPKGLTERYLREAVRQEPQLAPYLTWLKAEVRPGDPADIAAAGRD